MQLTPTASFSKDLGLDSLDAVEVVMAVEEVRLSHSRLVHSNVIPQEFSIEIPDVEADEIQTVQQGMVYIPSILCVSRTFSAIDYIAKTPEGMFCCSLLAYYLLIVALAA